MLKIKLENFEEALNLLNDKLKENNLSITIRAVGGFAMLKNELRNDGYTMDIDTATKKYSEKVIQLIQDVSEELDIDEDWLNNDCNGLDALSGVRKQLNWLSDKSYSNIKLYYADVNSLLLLKARAVEKSGLLLPRQQDKDDLLELLSYFDIKSVNEVKENPVSQFITSYPFTMKFLNDVQEW